MSGRSPRVGDPSGFGAYGRITRSEDRILCHECGRWLKAMTSHLSAAHEMTAAEYRTRHGLPVQRGLASEAVSRVLSERAIARREMDPAWWARFEEARADAWSRGLEAAHEAYREHLAPGARASLAGHATERFAGKPAKHDRSWQRGFAAYLAAWRALGVSPGRSGTPDEARAARWLEGQRREYRLGRMPEARRSALVNAGIDLAPGRGRRPIPWPGD